MLLKNNKTKLTQIFHFGLAGTRAPWPARVLRTSDGLWPSAQQQRVAQQNTYIALRSTCAAAPPAWPSGLLALRTPRPRPQPRPRPGNFFPA